MVEQVEHLLQLIATFVKSLGEKGKVGLATFMRVGISISRRCDLLARIRLRQATSTCSHIQSSVSSHQLLASAAVQEHVGDKMDLSSAKYWTITVLLPQLYKLCGSNSKLNTLKLCLGFYTGNLNAPQKICLLSKSTHCHCA